jgi:hypothetical protein
VKTIIAGNRDIAGIEFTDYELLSRLLARAPFEITEVVSGRARGVDRLGERWAREHNIPVKEFEVTGADWRIIGKGAGHLRNREMAAYAEALALIWDGCSRGSGGMLREARLLSLPIYAPCLRCEGTGYGELGSWGEVMPCEICGALGDMNRREQQEARREREF